jgi:hypothetical protein
MWIGMGWGRVRSGRKKGDGRGCLGIAFDAEEGDGERMKKGGERRREEGGGCR